MSTFQEDIRHFETIDSQTLAQKLDQNEELVAFIGRSSCPYCRRFAPKLAEAATDLQQKVYFVNSENNADTQLAAFRQKHGIATVPGLLVYKNDSIRVVCDSSLPVATIKELIG